MLMTIFKDLKPLFKLFIGAFHGINFILSKLLIFIYQELKDGKSYEPKSKGFNKENVKS
jgi:hypothetical protein